MEESESREDHIDEIQESFETIQRSLDALKDITDQTEALNLLNNIYGHSLVILDDAPTRYGEVKRLIDTASCWSQLWTTSRGSEYFVHPANITLRWKATDILHPVFDGGKQSLQDPTIPACYLPEDTAANLLKATFLEYNSLPLALGRRPLEENDQGELVEKRLEYAQDKFSITRVIGTTMWDIRGAITKPQIGYAPFSFFMYDPSLTKVVATHAQFGIQLRIDHECYDTGRHEYHMAYHIGDPIIEIKEP